MTAIDTNIIVRLLARDDARQYEQAYRVFQMEALFIPDTVLLETEWVLRYAYKQTDAEIAAALIRLLGLPNVSVANADTIHHALTWQQEGLDFADALHLAQSRFCSQLLTFDKKFVSQSANLSSCSVALP